MFLEGIALKTVDQYLIEWFNGLWGANGWGNLIWILLCLFFSVLAAGVIGYEREYHGHSAGLRTHILVSVGSCLVMILSIYGFGGSNIDGTLSSNRDPARLAAQVVSGIGFLGAGAIIKNGTDIRGLTTATTLWLCMALGLACGAGRLTFAVLGTIISLITLISLRRIERMATRKRPRIVIVAEQDKPVMRHILLLANEYRVEVKDMKSTVVTYKGQSCIRIIVSFVEISGPQSEAFAEDLRAQIDLFEINVLGKHKLQNK